MAVICFERLWRRRFVYVRRKMIRRSLVTLRPAASDDDNIPDVDPTALRVDSRFSSYYTDVI